MLKVVLLYDSGDFKRLAFVDKMKALCNKDFTVKNLFSLLLVDKKVTELLDIDNYIREADIVIAPWAIALGYDMATGIDIRWYYSDDKKASPMDFIQFAWSFTKSRYKLDENQRIMFEFKDTFANRRLV